MASTKKALHSSKPKRKGRSGGRVASSRSRPRKTTSARKRRKSSGSAQRSKLFSGWF